MFMPRYYCNCFGVLGRGNLDISFNLARCALTHPSLTMYFKYFTSFGRNLLFSTLVSSISFNRVICAWRTDKQISKSPKYTKMCSRCSGKIAFCIALDKHCPAYVNPNCEQRNSKIPLQGMLWHIGYLNGVGPAIMRLSYLFHWRNAYLVTCLTVPRCMARDTHLLCHSVHFSKVKTLHIFSRFSDKNQWTA